MEPKKTPVQIEVIKYHTIDSLLLQQFITIEETHDYSLMIVPSAGITISESMKDPIIKEAAYSNWCKLVEDYNLIVNDGNASVLFNTIRDARALNRINALEALYALWYLDPVYRAEKMKEMHIVAATPVILRGKIKNEVNRYQLRKKGQKSEKKQTIWNIITALRINNTPPITIVPSVETVRSFAELLKAVTTKNSSTPKPKTNGKRR